MALVYSSILPSMEILDCTDPFDFKPHIHDQYVVWLNTGCPEKFTLKDGTHVLEKGSVGIFEPGLVHSNAPCSREKRHLRSFYISPEFFSDLREQMGGSRGEIRFGQAIRDGQLWADLALLHQHMMTHGPSLETDGRVMEVFMEMGMRHGRNIRGLRPDLARCDHRVRRVEAYLKAHLDEPLRLETLAALADCTDYHLIRLFRQHKGLTPHAYLLQLRLEHARRMIQEGTPIAQAALASGFSDQSHLSRRFKHRYGLPPRSYARQSFVGKGSGSTT